MIVVDASALAKYLLREEGWMQVSTYVRERRPLYTVDHVVKEVANALWKHAYLRRLISSDAAFKLLEGLTQLIKAQVIVVELEDAYLKRALELAFSTGVTVYDTLYLAQAEKHGELLTSDKRQAKAAEQLGIKVYYVE